MVSKAPAFLQLLKLCHCPPHFPFGCISSQKLISHQEGITTGSFPSLLNQFPIVQPPNRELSFVVHGCCIPLPRYRKLTRRFGAVVVGNPAPCLCLFCLGFQPTNPTVHIPRGWNILKHQFPFHKQQNWPDERGYIKAANCGTENHALGVSWVNWSQMNLHPAPSYWLIKMTFQLGMNALQVQPADGFCTFSLEAVGGYPCLYIWLDLTCQIILEGDISRSF